MTINSEAKWQQYKTDFLRANKCTVDEFERAYIEFQSAKPDVKAYRLFARRWQITIIHEPALPEDLRVRLCVDISAIKVMAKTHAESEQAVASIISSIGMRGKLQ